MESLIHGDRGAIVVCAAIHQFVVQRRVACPRTCRACSRIRWSTDTSELEHFSQLHAARPDGWIGFLAQPIRLIGESAPTAAHRARGTRSCARYIPQHSTK